MRALFAVLATALLLGCPAKTGSDGSPGAQGPTGATGPQGPQGPKGDKGDKGDQGDPGQVLIADGGVLTGPAGPAGAGVVLVPLGVGDPNCPQGGVRVIADGGSANVCDGAPGGMGLPGMPGVSVTATPLTPGSICPYGGSQFTAGSAMAYACNGAPGSANVTFGLDGGGTPPVIFVGLTPQQVGGNLGGRTGANGLCAAAFSGSHFCTDWEFDQASPAAAIPAGGAWLDLGDVTTTSRSFHIPLGQGSYYTCVDWTSSSNSAMSGGNLATGVTVDPLGTIGSSFVGNGNGGCGNARPVACCAGGTRSRLAGYTPQTSGGNFGGRLGAHTLCSNAFPGSHFCTNWEYDQASVPVPPPGGSSWVDQGDVTTTTRYFHIPLGQGSYYTCVDWTSSSNSAMSGGNLATGVTASALGTFGSSFVGNGNGGCGNPRPLSCCY